MLQAQFVEAVVVDLAHVVEHGQDVVSLEELQLVVDLLQLGDREETVGGSDHVVHEVLGLLESGAEDFAYGLDEGDLVGVGGSEQRFAGVELAFHRGHEDELGHDDSFSVLNELIIKIIISGA